ncbi:transcriptional regulator TbsP domain-containing protein [Halorubrum aethiopicum]|uniref:transcriptional regulator TbsP domain-containing protein n=1 Tax=Halorubrum aethiopicum TaxID=1758255 RepID=UPI0012FEDA30|nr:DUF5821 family protein [Halorubrum aethiopicum]
MGVQTFETTLRNTRMPLLVDPSPRVIARLIDYLGETDRNHSINILASTDSLKAVFNDFYTATRAADCVADKSLTIHILQDPTENTVLVGTDTVSPLICVEDVEAIMTDNDDLVEQAQAYRDQFEHAHTYNIREPPLSMVEKTLAEEFNESIATDFRTTIERIEGVNEDTNAVTVALLIAAKHGEQQYRISKWGEDVGISSKATFSRRKSILEDEGVITTEKVPMDIGRPRHRLQLTEENAVQSYLG